MADVPTNTNRVNIFKGLLKGVLIGFIVAFVFAIMATLFSAMGATYPFITSVPGMAIFGFFIGLGLEVYPELL